MMHHTKKCHCWSGVKHKMNFVLFLTYMQIASKWDTNMAEQYDESLTDLDIVRLAATLSLSAMKSIAIEYMGFNMEHIINIQDRHRDNVVALNRDIIRTWRNRNSSAHAKQVCISRFSI